MITSDHILTEQHNQELSSKSAYARPSIRNSKTGINIRRRLESRTLAQRLICDEELEFCREHAANLIEIYLDAKRLADEFPNDNSVKVRLAIAGEAMSSACAAVERVAGSIAKTINTLVSSKYITNSMSDVDEIVSAICDYVDEETSDNIKRALYELNTASGSNMMIKEEETYNTAEVVRMMDSTIPYKDN